MANAENKKSGAHSEKLALDHDAVKKYLKIWSRDFVIHERDICNTFALPPSSHEQHQQENCACRGS